MALISLMVMMSSTVFTSCNDDDDDEGGDTGGNPILGKTGAVTITVENGASYSGRIDEVRLVYGDMTVLSDADYNNGSFTIDLPASFNSKYLDVVGEDIPVGVKVSNPSVKIGTAWLTAYKSGKWVGDFYPRTAEWEGSLMYATGDVSITGTGTLDDNEKGTFSVNLKQGWNLVYYGKYTETTREIITKAPSGARWVFDENSF
jgi:hypothetical protein